MLFLKEEKVFSLSKTAAAVPHGDINALFQEFYCYLLVVGLFREGEGVTGVHWNMDRISHANFTIPAGSYRSGLAALLTKGLKDRFVILSRHRDLSESEADLLTSFDSIFTADAAWFAPLRGRSIVSVAYSRSFSDDMKIIARYVSAMYGQLDYPEPYSVPKIYLSLFGNIHLARQETVILDAPVLRYGSVDRDNNNVTALWSLLSAQVTSLSREEYPADTLGDMLAGYAFLSASNEFEASLPIPRYAVALYLQRIMGLEGSNPVSMSASFYKEFLYSTTRTISISRQALYIIILNLMMEKMDESHLSHLFTENSYYRKLLNTSSITGSSLKRPAILDFALESLIDQEMTNEDNNQDLTSDTEQDPQTDSNGYDPSEPPPVMAMPIMPLDKDTIGLLSFDKTGEGVNEDLYRTAVVALNDRLQQDDSVDITAEVKEALKYWVNGFLYRTALDATKDQIAVLNLQSYLKNVSTKG